MSTAPDQPPPSSRRTTDASARASYAWALHELGDSAGARGAAIDAAAAWLDDASDLTEADLLALLDAVDGDGRALLAMVRVACALAPTRASSQALPSGPPRPAAAAALSSASARGSAPGRPARARGAPW